MASNVVIQKLLDGSGALIVKCSYRLDTADLASTLVYDPAAGVQDGSMSTPPLFPHLKEMAFAVQTPIAVLFTWDGGTPADMFVATEANQLCFADAVVTNNALTPTGKIFTQTFGVPATGNFVASVWMTFTKGNLAK